MRLETERGAISISPDVFTNITGAAATNCYGVKGMAVRSTTDGLVHLLKRESMAPHHCGQRRKSHRRQPLHHE